MKPSFGSDYLDDNITQYTKIHCILFNRGYDINRGHYSKRVVINIRACKNISGLVKISVTSPAGLMTFFLNVEPCQYDSHDIVFRIVCLISIIRCMFMVEIREHLSPLRNGTSHSFTFANFGHPVSKS